MMFFVFVRERATVHAAVWLFDREKSRTKDANGYSEPQMTFQGEKNVAELFSNGAHRW